MAVEVALAGGKSKMVPLEALSMQKIILNGHSLKMDQIYRQFVASCSNRKCRWVLTKVNPTDIATKWGKGSDLLPSGQRIAVLVYARGSVADGVEPSG